VDVWRGGLKSAGCFHVPSDSEDPVSSGVCRRIAFILQHLAWGWRHYCPPKRRLTFNQGHVVSLRVPESSAALLCNVIPFFGNVQNFQY
jgi:hypothetical protein